ncbi:MAG: alpha/beta hydrolase [Bacteroidia bacterium]
MKKILKASIYGGIIIFLILNIIAFAHAYRFTHFKLDKSPRTKEPKNLSLVNKIKTIVWGVNIPKPTNGDKVPNDYKVLSIKSNKLIECWYKEVPNSKGTVILFHGYSSVKITLLGKAKVFRKLGYNTLLVDFMGSGGSEGNQSTIGYFESEQVKSAFKSIKKTNPKKIILYGSSMGAVAIMKAIHDGGINPNGIIIECPFATMYETVQARFKIMKIPSFPMANLLVFWGGIQNGFWAFNHNPEEYAHSIKCPTLLLYGAKDEKVSLDEINRIYRNLNEKKKLNIYKNAGHENYLNKYEKEWTIDIRSFMEKDIK